MDYCEVSRLRRHFVWTVGFQNLSDPFRGGSGPLAFIKQQGSGLGLERVVVFVGVTVRRCGWYYGNSCSFLICPSNDGGTNVVVRFDFDSGKTHTGLGRVVHRTTG